MSNLNFKKGKRIMKTMKYVMMGALMLSVGTPAIAQDGTKADVAAVKNLIASKQTDAKSLICTFLIPVIIYFVYWY